MVVVYEAAVETDGPDVARGAREDTARPVIGLATIREIRRIYGRTLAPIIHNGHQLPSVGQAPVGISPRRKGERLAIIKGRLPFTRAGILRVSLLPHQTCIQIRDRSVAIVFVRWLRAFVLCILPHRRTSRLPPIRGMGAAHPTRICFWALVLSSLSLEHWAC